MLHGYKLLLLSKWPVVLFLVRFNNFDQTIGFCWSYMLLLKPPVLMCSWCGYMRSLYVFVSISGASSFQIKKVVTHHTMATDPTTLAVIVRSLTSTTPNPGHHILAVGDRDGLSREKRDRREEWRGKWVSSCVNKNNVCTVSHKSLSYDIALSPRPQTHTHTVLPTSFSQKAKK